MIRSFVRREGRMTRAQATALEQHWPHYGIDYTARPLNPREIFGRSAPLTMDIGPGMGLTTVSLAAAHPERDYLAVEVHRPGIGSLLQHASGKGLGNIRAINHDAVEVIRDMLADNSLDQVLILFPDPWPKKRHHKRRLLNTAFAELLRPKLRGHALVYIATDWPDYAEQIPGPFENGGYLNLAGRGRVSPRPRWRPLTKFEQRGLRLGHGVSDFVFCRTLDD
ncbi:MAG: tRNA (guanosine(46)-N7)-methyltransferase TrmB [Gammaproteobacteria bacterium]|nr:tRNA (guanosine(46)-N7)-methyltransferase TrmB [Gammaproteobacteria bacterium]